LERIQGVPRIRDAQPVTRAQTKPGATLASTHQHCCLAVGDKEKAREPPDKKAC
jgi:hypothetical protein